MAHPRIEEWLLDAPGHYMDPDGVYAYQCVDVPIDYAKWLWPDADWETQTFGRNNANGHMQNKRSKYWEVIWNGPGLYPQRGDVIIWAGDHINPYGHIAVVLDATKSTVSVIEQNRDMSARGPARVGSWGYDNPGTGMVMGWLRPKLATVAAASGGSINPIKEIAVKLSDIVAKLKAYGWWYKGNTKKDAWWHLVNAAANAAYKTVREPISAIDPKDNKKITASLAAYLVTIWKRVHRDLPTWITQIFKRFDKTDAKLDVIIDMLEKQGSGITAAEVDKIVDASLQDNIPGLLDAGLEDAVVNVDVTINRAPIDPADHPEQEEAK